jgi:predicted glycoside hydrolase/deacetylase ChbG (UPF0249 family)
MAPVPTVAPVSAKYSPPARLLAEAAILEKPIRSRWTTQSTKVAALQGSTAVATVRQLIVTADDFGIGPATSQGILDLARSGRVTATVLLVSSPHAEAAVRAWKRAGRPMELGWHPCLTLDRPILPAGRVSTLVDREGRFYPLGTFLSRLLLGRMRREQIQAELRAQYDRFRELVGSLPSVVNSHHHVQIFPPIGALLAELLSTQIPAPYVRRVREPLGMLALVPGARRKRFVLNSLGRYDARRQERLGLPGNDWLAGITDPPCVHEERYLTRWLQRIPGDVVELTCHPGHRDETLIGRDCTDSDGQLERRVREFHLLEHPSFSEACCRAGLTLAAPLTSIRRRGQVAA